VNVHAVCCSTCGCTGPIENYENASQTEERAVELWNARTAGAQLRPYISRHGMAVAAPDAPLVQWWEQAVALHESAIAAVSDRHFRDASQHTAKLRNHLQAIPVTVPPGWELVRKADGAVLSAPEPKS
jgi:hypothetical protein